MFESLVIIFTLLYILDLLWLRRGLVKCTLNNFRENKNKELPFVSVVVAARNEESNIRQCLESLNTLNYPQDKLEIIVVDDRSTDTTAEIISSFIPKNPNFKLLQIAKEGVALRGKANALAVALDDAKGDIFMFTDADCIVSTDWVLTTARNCEAEIGIIGGYTILLAENTFQAIQSIDWLLHFSVSAAVASHSIPITVIGNNFTVTRKAYEKAGGFRNIPFSVTEDYALVQAIAQNTTYKIRFLLSAQTKIESLPCETWKQIYHQKKRWGVGALDMVWQGVFIIGLGYVAHLVLFFGLFFVPLSFMMSLFFIKSLVDIFFLWKPMKEFRLFHLLKYFPAFEIYYFFYGLAFPFFPLFAKNVTWKGRKF